MKRKMGTGLCCQRQELLEKREADFAENRQPQRQNPSHPLLSRGTGILRRDPRAVLFPSYPNSPFSFGLFSPETSRRQGVCSPRSDA